MVAYLLASFAIRVFFGVLVPPNWRIARQLLEWGCWWLVNAHYQVFESDLDVGGPEAVPVDCTAEEVTALAYFRMAEPRGLPLYSSKSNIFLT